MSGLKHRFRWSCLALAVAGVVAGCGAPTPPSISPTGRSTASYLPIHKPMNGGPAAIVGGALVERGGASR
jgi:hypothetical protein